MLILIAGHVADRYDRRIIILLCLAPEVLPGGAATPGAAAARMRIFLVLRQMAGFRGRSIRQR